MQKDLYHNTLVVIENASHMVPVDQPAAIAKVIRDWLNSETEIN